MTTITGSVDRNLVRINTAWAGAAVIMDARLVIVNSVTRTDEFCALQVVEKNGQYAFWRNKGSTGMEGSGEVAQNSGQECKRAFSEAFESLTGVTYTSALAGAEPVPGRFEWLDVAVEDEPTTQQAVLWEYYVDNQVDGKTNGWYPYEEAASAIVDDLYHDFAVAKNEHMSIRFVKSGYWTYRVDLAAMKQRNSNTGTERKIRRTINGIPQVDADQNERSNANTNTDGCDDGDDTMSDATDTQPVAPSTPTRRGKTATSRSRSPTQARKNRRFRRSLRRSPRLLEKNGLRRSPRIQNLCFFQYF